MKLGADEVPNCLEQDGKDGKLLGPGLTLHSFVVFGRVLSSPRTEQA